MQTTAIMVDGGFYRRRAQTLMGDKTAADRAKELMEYCHRHLREKSGKRNELYRIFYYDCPPISKRVFHPFLQRTVDFAKSDLYTWMTVFLEELKKQRKVALRLGKLAESQAHYNLNPETLKKLYNGKLTLPELTEEDFQINILQKGVDMKIGLDIASLSYKKQVNQIILISADSDFVPAAKLARREGIDFILDPMWAAINPELHEHIDGLRSCTGKPTPKVPSTALPAEGDKVRSV
ncbi:MAG: NYN domain-containing protein [Deltaproteobacteria bacterium]